MTALSTTIQPPLSRSDIDRDDQRRLVPGALEALHAESTSRAILLHDGRFAVTPQGLALWSPEAIAGAVTVAYLGRSTEPDDGGERTSFLLQTVETAPDVPGIEWVTLRDIATTLSARDAGLATEASALNNWHRSSAFCPRCGSATEVTKAGWARECAACGNEIFPRTDPAVIVAVHDSNDRILLGSNALWEHNRYSVLAGFVEAGESLEA
ncbi:MAG: NAD(+) diphosphatase, partial [Mycetocola sp.]